MGPTSSFSCRYPVVLAPHFFLKMALLQDCSSLYWLPSQITSHFSHFTLFSSSLLHVVVPPGPGLIEPQKPADSRAFWTFVFFGEMFIQVFHPFVCFCCCWVVQVLYICWILSPIRYMICKYFLPLCELPFSSCWICLWCTDLNFFFL